MIFSAVDMNHLPVVRQQVVDLNLFCGFLVRKKNEIISQKMFTFENNFTKTYF